MRYAPRIAFAIIVCGLIASCEQVEKSPSKLQPREGRPLIALIMKSLANEFFVTMANGARAHHEKHLGQYDLIVNGIKNEIDIFPSRLIILNRD